jgi:aminotransferase in exopolysaccharide biosynthesis
MNDAVENLVKAYRKVYNTEDYIPLHSPVFRGEEKKYLLDCIESTFVSSVGKYVDNFQSALAEYCGAKYALATVNGTAALHLSLLINDIGMGDEVICPDVTFAATAAAIVYTGADPIFLDIDEETLGLSAEKVEAFLEHNTREINGKRINKVTGKHVKACMAMHNIGFSVEIDSLEKICLRYNLLLIEDAAEALGSRIGNKMLGTFGCVGVYSFNGNKIITTGGGGALVTDSKDLFDRALHLSTTAKVPHPFIYEHDDIGFNYRMPSINAALGVAQLKMIEEFLEIKTNQIELLKTLLNKKFFSVVMPKYGVSNNWFFLIRINRKDFNIQSLITSLGRSGIMARTLWSRLSKMKPYQKYIATENKVADKVLDQVLCLPNGVV